ncbi:MAG: cell wall hydrolase [Novosphingobium sp.]|nr:cell wall hydrolase [Novosphingobium sp.]
MLIAIAATALLMAVIAAVLWPAGPLRAPAHLPDARRLAQLPARPADIEAHGAAAVSVLPPDAARLANSKVPYAAGPLATAKPFQFRGSEEDRARAVECLASAVLYEAGDDTRGEAAVAQVVLNRVRHAAFPATVCGVVYQGSQRSNGCQFTFTCDGSLRRSMPDGSWRRAREVAERALSGEVDEDVGLATHYHTDWVYPYWSPSLRKLARVETHLFFGWPGDWGGPYAFLRKYQGGEPGFAAVATSSPTASASAAADEAEKFDKPPPVGMTAGMLFGSHIRLADPRGGAYGLLTPPGVTPAKLVNTALGLCPGAGTCTVDAWDQADQIPPAFPIPPQARASAIFEFRREPGTSADVMRFDCKRFPTVPKALCR